MLIQLIFFLPAALLAIIFLFLLNFYRDPKRSIPEGNVVVSPADGKIISIIRTKGPDMKISKGLFGKIKTLSKDIGKDCYAVSIFMSPLDVHYNRSPVGGKVLSTLHQPGKFFKAYDLEKSLMNEKNEIIIQNKRLGKVKVIQIAGFLARRISCFVKAGQKIDKGDKVGFISLGSQATVILSSKAHLKVKKGDKVKAGSSVIASY
ncbi:phosphatidylserine decarboxylase family protein [Candidatus Woesearchaeota archaeon]|nr:phosphatidylserine decarboxylase family protein [Candidatus Woesearchaeota archaeon]